MSKIHIKIMSEDAYAYLKFNLSRITQLIQENDNNDWIFNEFPSPIFIEKKYEIEDFELKLNPDSKDKQIDFENSILLYERLKDLPRYILTNEKFWLWMYFDKFYSKVRTMMTIKGVSTIKDHWTFSQGVRRGLMFGVLSRCFFRVQLTCDDTEDKYELTRWILENPERFRNLTWRTFSSEVHLTRGCIKGEKRAVEELGENNSVYPEIAKYISEIGGVKLLDVISEQDIEQTVYEKMCELLNN